MTNGVYIHDVTGIWRDDTSSLSHYDAEYMERAIALWADPRIGIRYYVNSGSRSYTQQKALYNTYLNGGALAAKPGTSNHEYDAPRHRVALAMDVNPRDGKGGSYDELHKVAYEYGFHFPLPSELWHMEKRPGRGPLPARPNPAPTSLEIDMEHCKWNEKARAYVNSKGEVFCPEVPGRPTAKHFGGMTDLRDDAKKSFSGTTVAIIPIDDNDSQAGYYLVDESWKVEEFKFDASVKKFFK